MSKATKGEPTKRELQDVHIRNINSDAWRCFRAELAFRGEEIGPALSTILADWLRGSGWSESN